MPQPRASPILLKACRIIQKIAELDLNNALIVYVIFSDSHDIPINSEDIFPMPHSYNLVDDVFGSTESCIPVYGGTYFEDFGNTESDAS